MSTNAAPIIWPFRQIQKIYVYLRFILVYMEILYSTQSVLVAPPCPNSIVLSATLIRGGATNHTDLLVKFYPHFEIYKKFLA